MKNNALKKGGMDTIVAYVVVSLPLIYVLIFMVATLYHFSVQMYINQAVKETLIMASSYGEMTESMDNFLRSRLNNIDDRKDSWAIKYGYRKMEGGVVGEYDEDTMGEDFNIISKAKINKGDMIGIQVRSNRSSLLGSVSQFGLFGSSGTELRYSAFREEIVRNDAP